MNYDKLNRIIKDFFNNKDYESYLETMGNIKKLSEIFILNYNYINSSSGFNTEISLTDSIDISNSFFKSIDKKYSKEFLRLLNSYGKYDGCVDASKTVEFTKISPLLINKFNRSGVTSDGKVYIDYCETVFDIFDICHEIVHRFSYKGYESLIKKYLGETTSILSELYLSDYLKDNTNINEEDINKYIIYRFNTAFDDAISVYIQITLIELYIKNGNVNELILTKYLDSLSKTDIYDRIYDKCISKVKNIIKSDEMDFFIRQRYVIGLVCALELKRQNSFKSFNKLVEIFGKDDSDIDNDIATIQNIIPIFYDKSFSFDENRVIKNINEKIKIIKNKKHYN